MNLSSKGKEAIKTALAVVIAYYIALSLDWLNPSWAAFAVAFVSLATIGQSFAKAAMRMIGTFVGVAVALFLLGLYPQDRWLFIGVLSLYLGFCSYMMSRNKQQYFWSVSGFVCVIICATAGPDPTYAFHLAMSRTQETGLGILVYTLVTLLLWPNSSQSDFVKVTGELVSTQKEILSVLLKSLKGQDESSQSQGLRTKLLKTQTQFSTLLQATINDTYNVWELRKQWRSYSTYAERLTRSITRFYNNLDSLNDIDPYKLVTNLDDIATELDMRLSHIERMLSNQSVDEQNVPILIEPLVKNIQSLKPPQQIALGDFQTHLTELLQLTETIYDICSDICEGTISADIPERVTTNRCFLPDLDGLKGVFLVILNIWIAFLAIVYIDGLPGGFAALSIVGSIALNISVMPQVSIRVVYKPVFVGLVVGGIAYLFIMPYLSEFFELALLLFVFTFGFCYLYSEPQQVLGRAAGLALFFTLTSISNDQSYTLFKVTTTGLMFAWVLFLFTFSVNIPFSVRPEKVFLRLLHRYFRSYLALISTITFGSNKSVSWYQRVIYSFHLREIQTLPQKIATWIPFVGTAHLPGTTSEQLQELNSSLQTLSYRLEIFIEESSASFSHQSEIDRETDIALLSDWLTLLQQQVQNLARTSPKKESENLEQQTQRLFSEIENKLQSEVGTLRFNRMLVACREISQALVLYGNNASVIDWQPWNENRF